MSNSPSLIYWANALFSQADRDFNIACATKLRNAGYQVFLPQEAEVNDRFNKISATAQDIFQIDTQILLNAQLLVACIDQETIDSGVACEIGIAFSHGIPIIGLYTDIRQQRFGAGKMYKNLYVIGAIELMGEIATSVDDLLHIISQKLPLDKGNKLDAVVQHFNSVSSQYDNFITKLESWYFPHWSVIQVIDRMIDLFSPKRILEIGSGSGWLSKHICQRSSDIFYMGYDKSEDMVAISQNNNANLGGLFTDDWLEIEYESQSCKFDIAIICFTLHDQPSPLSMLINVAHCLQPNGKIVIVDLSTFDLPRLVNLLRQKVVIAPSLHDLRIDLAKLIKWVNNMQGVIEHYELVSTLVNFPSTDDIDNYLEFFGIYQGMDLPFRFKLSEKTKQRSLVKEILSEQSYPFTDQRCFIICTINIP